MLGFYKVVERLINRNYRKRDFSKMSHIRAKYCPGRKGMPLINTY